MSIWPIFGHGRFLDTFFWTQNDKIFIGNSALEFIISSFAVSCS